MHQPVIYPCLWFDNQAHEAAAFYCATFRDSRLLQQSPMAVTFEVDGTRFMSLNGGPMYTVNQAMSFFKYCGSEAEIDRLFVALSDGGKVIFPLQAYDWSAKYAWVVDKYGVSWQLDIDPIRSSQTIVPCLLFVNEKMAKAQSALHTYMDAFPDSRLLMEMPFTPESGVAEGALMFAQVKLGTYILNLMSSTETHDFDFTAGNSLVVQCETQEEIDYYWEKLGAGGQYEPCGWLLDAYGVSWQVVPAVLGRLMADPDRAPRVIDAFLKMKKFDIGALMNA